MNERNLDAQSRYFVSIAVIKQSLSLKKRKLNSIILLGDVQYYLNMKIVGAGIPSDEMKKGLLNKYSFPLVKKISQYGRMRKN